mmetsp:Transcript_18621/g.53354  ORF Transcript_18621/g.53354 Transcript_18621/m.53354 type:complete len:704 (+) Transcript_18621:56-2167(+)|eukprot:CAMPEP_0170243832 /NCGR_PEP_ID=MMETSP0116_2-20130129/21693_1 /TAXON_ID=400756 /ORGANISM="Durinskia baltica, Strain CSIRO CS-38" /LENGTH=703 /DNA_ID=CAMNT_0010494689 /DNA_START=50 /DNA_END=2161 /DNA_ORIENTATION=-
MTGVSFIAAAFVAVCAASAAAFFQLVSKFIPVAVFLVSAFVLALASVGQRAVHFLSEDEQLLVEGWLERTAHNGPGVKFVNPMTFRSARIRKAITLSATSYAKVSDTKDGSERIVEGPKLLFLGPYDELMSKSNAVSLSNTEYAVVINKLTGERSIVKGPRIFFPGPHDDAMKGEAVSMNSTEYIYVEDKLTGERKTVRGPCVWFPEPFDSVGRKLTAITLQEDEYLRLRDAASGKRWVQKGKALVFLEPTWEVENSKKNGGVAKAWSLKAYEYVRLIDSVTGKITVHRGEKVVFPGPDETLVDGEILQALDLKVHEYVKLLDQATGVVRVESGSSTGTGSNQVFLGPHEKILDGGKQKAIEVDENHAVLVRDKATGQLRLVKEKQLFVPGPDEKIEEVRQLIRLADHEAMIVRGKDGDFQYFYGSEEKRQKGQSRSFFLEPYDEIVKLCWSKGRRRESRNLFIERFDCRPQFMSFEFNCRTSDNVELILEGTFFWEVVDLPAMVKSTGDTSGDLCNHARSQFIRHVARVTLKQFMEESHLIAKKVWEEDTEFYKSRGVKIHSLEVTRYQCADQSTSEILEQIIQETTNRMNRLSQAESENEVGLFRTQGQIQQEQMNGDLLKIQHEHTTDEAKVTGCAEAARIAAFMDGLKDVVPKNEDRVAMWQVLRKTEALSVVSQGNASLYFTPNDVDLSIESRGKNTA